MRTEDQWESDRLDVDTYLERLGIAGPLDPTPGTLRRLHRAHVTTIPFENLDVVLGRGVDLDLGAMQAKLLESRRGGYCYEHNLLFAALLGAAVDRLVVRRFAAAPRFVLTLATIGLAQVLGAAAHLRERLPVGARDDAESHRAQLAIRRENGTTKKPG